LARANLVELLDAVFEKDGKLIPYRNVKLTREGTKTDKSVELELAMRDSDPPSVKREGGKKRRGTGAAASTTVVDAALEKALRAWRMAEAKKRGIPAFRIFSDQALRSMAAAGPKTEQELLAIPGVGTSTAAKYGSQIYRIVSEGRT
jgi:superfamily II DNA helicase RecQ